MKNMVKRSLLVLGITLLTSITVMANTKYILMINNKKIDTKIIVENGVTYVPLRLVSEALDAKVSVDNGVISVNSNVIIQEDIGTMIYNNREYPLPRQTIQEEVYEMVSDNLTEEEKLLVKEVKELFNKDIIIKNGEVREVKNGKTYHSRSKEMWIIEVAGKKERIKNEEIDRKETLENKRMMEEKLLDAKRRWEEIEN